MPHLCCLSLFIPDLNHIAALYLLRKDCCHIVFVIYLQCKNHAVPLLFKMPSIYLYRKLLSSSEKFFAYFIEFLVKKGTPLSIIPLLMRCPCFPSGSSRTRSLILNTMRYGSSWENGFAWYSHYSQKYQFLYLEAQFLYYRADAFLHDRKDLSYQDCA